MIAYFIKKRKEDGGIEPVENEDTAIDKKERKTGESNPPTDKSAHR